CSRTLFEFLVCGDVSLWRSVSARNTHLAADTEVDPWQSDSSGITHLAVGAEVDPWQSDAGRITQFAVGAAPRENHLARQ
ncbi:hypothetical protein, partial [Pseudomonas aeruginosa]|uniref:hypothetical protein n=1 Tax=Pseudomonas aeruginosa TaxID=287 RepID=UPI001C4F99E4